MKGQLLNKLVTVNSLPNFITIWKRGAQCDIFFT